MFCRTLLQSCAMCNRTYTSQLIKKVFEDDKVKKTLLMKVRTTNIKETDVTKWSNDIKDVRLKIKNMECFGFIEFSSEQQADKYYKAFQGKKVDNQPVSVDYCGAKSKHGEPAKVLENDPLELFVSGLAESVTESRLHEIFPTATDIALPTRHGREDGKKFMYAFVRFKTAEACAKALKETRNNAGLCVEQGYLKKFVEQNDPLKLFVSGLAESVTESRLHEIFPTATDIALHTIYGWEDGKKFRYAFVRFKTAEACAKALKETRNNAGLCVEQGYLKKFVEQNDPLKLFVSGLAESVTESRLHEIFPTATDIALHTIYGWEDGKKFRYAFVRFKTAEACAKALKETRNNAGLCVEQGYLKKSVERMLLSDLKLQKPVPKLLRKLKILEEQGYPKKSVELDRSVDSSWTLRLPFFKFACSKQDIYNLSKDILHVDIKSNQYGKRFATLTFSTKELTDENYQKLREKGLGVQYTGYMQSSLIKKESKQLHLMFPCTNITEEYISSLSKDILSFQLYRRSKFCSAYVLFPSENCAEQNYIKLRHKGIHVDYVGYKKRHSEDHLTLWMLFNDPLVEREDIRDLSEDIINLDLKWRSKWSSIAFASFATEEHADRNCELIRSKGIKCDFKGQKGILISELDSKSLLLRFPNGFDTLSEEPVKNLLADVKEIKGVLLGNGSFVIATFETEELTRKNHAAFAKQDNFFSYIRQQPVSEKGLKRLWIFLPYPEITVAMVKELSDDIVNVSLHWRAKYRSFALVSFASEELRKKNFLYLQSKNLIVRYMDPKHRTRRAVGKPDETTVST